MPERIHASHILLMYAGSENSSADRSKDDAMAEISGLLDQLTEGADFAALAKKHSDCASAASGGELGEFAKGEMVPEFEEAAFTLKPGETSAVVETGFGFHLIHRTA